MRRRSEELFPAMILFLSIGTGACTGADAPAMTTAEPGSSTTGEPTSTPTTGEPSTASTSTGAAETTGSTSTGEPGSSSGPPSYCGDGIIDPGEACDAGPANSDAGACTNQCTLATCGDSLVWDGFEECDFGANSSDDYGGCTDLCAWAARCGDGVLDADREECDFGDLNGTGPMGWDLPGCTLGCRWVARIVFVTSATYTGDLGGLSGADLKCRNLATAAGIDNAKTFRAWLSDGFEWPASRFQQTGLVGAPYVLLDGRIIAWNFNGLVDSGPYTGISITEQGEAVVERQVWTNTSAFGERFSPVDHCDHWTSSAFDLSARVGWNALAVQAGPAWTTWHDERHFTSYVTGDCSWPRRLYCFEDGYAPED